ncbi:MAG: NAD-dependent epimerase/dehydratase family protein [Deltaproteobacteria bacterium]|nr:NAD-dependent epimerase/dehydratase family protein [Deltaproteobacteria bacterium]MBW1996059.1 NAD-dependent epimerase/dehydratase family protein [Deltaproteobacteria bacterium]MBW2150302.1 NAD-dependent epimerase/dehydratase family protein [Deltaproteobacteria bacterium]
MKVLILGGTGVISRAIVDRLLTQNHEVILFNRGNNPLRFVKDVQHITGDRLNREVFKKRFQKESFDAVIDMICFNKEDAISTVETFRDRTDQIVICSTIAAYKRPYRTVPTIEDEEALHDDPKFGYAFHKAEMERYLRPIMEEERLPITIIRPSLTYGIGAANIGVLRQNYGIVDRIRKGKPLVMFGDGCTSWSWTFAPDLAKAFVGVLANKNTLGKVYHATSEERRIWKDLYLEIGKIIGKTPQLVYIPSELLYSAAPNLCNHLLFEKTFAGLFDNSKIKKDVPSFRVEISLSEGMEMIVEWWEKEASAVDPEKDILEDRLVSIYYHWANQMKNLYTK